MKFIVGIDEAGRGALAGPVAVGVFVVPVKVLGKWRKYFSDYPVGRDSKKLSAKQREFWFARIKEGEQKELGRAIVSFSSASVIDREGIVPAISRALAASLLSLAVKPEEVSVLLDGGLKAPIEYKNQTTIIKGDEKELIISLASIAAKVTRDQLMKKLAKKYPLYGFEKHKGYGTRVHLKAIKEGGLCSLHREYFCKKIKFNN